MNQNSEALPESLSDIRNDPATTMTQDQTQATQQHNEATTPSYDIPSTPNMADAPNYQFLVVILVVAIFCIVVIKPTRDFMIWVIKDILLPSLHWFFKIFSVWVLWLFKKIINSHLEFFKHLSTPRAIIFPQLDDQRAENDKSINRKVKK